MDLSERGVRGTGEREHTARPLPQPEVQVLVHAGYHLAQKDYRELYLLRERFVRGYHRASELINARHAREYWVVGWIMRRDWSC